MHASYYYRAHVSHQLLAAGKLQACRTWKLC